MALAIYRVYPSTPESVESLKLVDDLKEVHIVLAFARDAPEKKNGVFAPYFNPNFTPDWIREFKNKSKSNVKVFLSIGGRKYPFCLQNRHEWVKNAFDSLKDIVNHYGFDGIDVYYEHVDQPNSRDGNEFAVAIRDVISKLRTSNKGLKLSLTVSAPPNSLYEKLYNLIPADVDYVVLQIFSVTSPIFTADDLVRFFDSLTNTYPKAKMFAGHSILPSDWTNVPLPIFLGAIPKLFEKGIVSLSEWAVTDHDPEA